MAKQVVAAVFAGVALLGWCDRSVPAQERPPTTTAYQVTEGIQYGGGDPGQVLDLYLPDASARKGAALVVFNHGSGDKGPLVRWFAERGYTVLLVNVRRRMAYPFPVRDAFCAVAWAHARGQGLGVEPNMLVAVGHSGGAILAAHLGTVDDRSLYLEGCPHPDPGEDWVRGVVSIAGIFDYRAEEEFGAPHNAYTPRYFGGSKEDVPEVWAQASPGTWIDGSEPPFLLIHGTAVGVLREAGVDVRYVTVPGADHDSILGTAAFLAMESFIERVARQGGR